MFSGVFSLKCRQRARYRFLTCGGGSDPSAITGWQTATQRMPKRVDFRRLIRSRMIPV